jgi:hypothetical protein
MRTTPPKTVLAMTAAFILGSLVTFATIQTVGPQAAQARVSQVSVDRP